jgi:hypothetical protein
MFHCEKVDYIIGVSNRVATYENNKMVGHMNCDNAQFDEFGHCDKCFKEE